MSGVGREPYGGIAELLEVFDEIVKLRLADPGGADYAALDDASQSKALLEEGDDFMV